MARLQHIGAQVSMSAVGTPYDNAKAESFCKTLTPEETYRKDYQTWAEAAASIGQFIADVDNGRRPPSSLGYAPPAEFEAACARLTRG